jgi:hypothetical protein
MLHITNGDTAADQMRAGGIAGEILPWRDVLHEGPIPAGLSLTSLRHVRSRFIASCGWGELAAVQQEFARRDAVLESFPDHQEVVLWFEGDLYDQLQLVQILDWFHGRSLGPTRLSMVASGEPLGTLAADRFEGLLDSRKPVTPDELEGARGVWLEVRNPDPSGLERLVRRGIPALPRLDAALFRFLQEFPSVRNGLSRTEDRALQTIGHGRSRLCEVFVASHHEQEERVFLGDAAFALSLQRMSDVEIPLLLVEDGSPVRLPRGGGVAEEFWQRRAVLTPSGRDVAGGKLDHVRLNGISRWLGGTFLQGRGPVWRWDEDRQVLAYL